MSASGQGVSIEAQRYERIMATRVGVHVLAEPGAEATAHARIDACMEWFKEVDTRLTRFNAGSELSRLNAAAGNWQSVSPLLLDALAQSVQAAQDSDGLFDPTLLALLEMLGYDRDFSAIRHSETHGAAHSLWVGGEGDVVTGGWRAIELDAAQLRVRLPFGVGIDLGGIAKGWAADVALERYFAPDDHALLYLGGDVHVRGGPEPGGLWALGLGASEEALHADPATLPVVTLGAGGLAVSGARDRWWYRNGMRQHHIIDPRTARPARMWIDERDHPPGGDDALIVAATALAPTAAHAEVAAKVAIMRGYPLALREVEAAWAHAANGGETATFGDAPVALILALSTGEMIPSVNLDEYLTTYGGGGTTWLT